MMANVSVCGITSEEFNLMHGVRQGCVLAPTLFTLFLSAVMFIANRETENCIMVTSRTDGKLFNVGRLKAKTKVHTIRVSDLMYADDTGLVAHSETELQLMLD